jgi:hypothetical protein
MPQQLKDVIAPKAGRQPNVLLDELRHIPRKLARAVTRHRSHPQVILHTLNRGMRLLAPWTLRQNKQCPRPPATRSGSAMGPVPKSSVYQNLELTPCSLGGVASEARTLQLARGDLSARTDDEAQEAPADVWGHLLHLI